MHEIGVREIVQFAGMTFNVETLEMTWIAMAIVILIAFLATRNRIATFCKIWCDSEAHSTGDDSDSVSAVLHQIRLLEDDHF